MGKSFTDRFIDSEAKEEDGSDIIDSSDDDAAMDDELSSDTSFIDDDDELDDGVPNIALYREVMNDQEEDIIDFDDDETITTKPAPSRTSRLARQVRHMENKYKGGERGGDVSDDGEFDDDADAYEGPSDPTLSITTSPDLPIWRVRCRLSKEMDVLNNFLMIMSQLEAKRQKSCKVRGMMSLSSYPGYVFVEAASTDSISQLQIPGLLREFKKCRPQEVRDAIMQEKRGLQMPDVGAWLRVTKGPFAGEYVLVSHIDNNSIYARCIPSINLPLVAQMSHEHTHTPGDFVAARSEHHKLVTKADLDHYNVRYHQLKTMWDLFEIRSLQIEVDTGFIIRSFKLNQLEAVDHPDEKFQELFEEGAALAGKPLESFCSGESTRPVEIPPLGQRVRFISGEAQGAVGTITVRESANSSVVVTLDDGTPISGNGTQFVPVVQVTDTVQIYCGRHKGVVGVVTKVTDSRCTLQSNDQLYEVSLREVANQGTDTAVTAYKGIAIGDCVVSVGDNQVGVVLALNAHGRGTVLSTNGVRLNVPLSSLTRYRVRGGRANDSEDNSFGIGAEVELINPNDNVKKLKLDSIAVNVLGLKSDSAIIAEYKILEKLKGDQEGLSTNIMGKVRHIYKDSVFFTTDNGEYYCAPSTALKISSDEGAPRASTYQPRGTSFVKKHAIMGTRVFIIGGQYKGKMGDVRDEADTVLRIKLDTTGATVTVDKSHISFPEAGVDPETIRMMEARGPRRMGYQNNVPSVAEPSELKGFLETSHRQAKAMQSEMSSMGGGNVEELFSSLDANRNDRGRDNSRNRRGPPGAMDKSDDDRPPRGPPGGSRPDEPVPAPPTRHKDEYDAPRSNDTDSRNSPVDNVKSESVPVKEEEDYDDVVYQPKRRRFD